MKPMKPRPPGSVCDAIVRLFGQIARSLGLPVTDGVRIAGNKLGKSDSLMRKVSDPDQPEKMSLQDAAILTSAFGASAIAEFFAYEAGGVFVRFTEPNGRSRWFDLASISSQEFGEFIATLFRALDPSGPGGAAVTLQEARELLPEVEDIIRVLLHARSELRAVIAPPATET